MGFDLNGWHRQLHAVTGGMALKWCRASSSDLQQWAKQLRSVVVEMEVAAATGQCEGELEEEIAFR
jgi:hypothetical protein